MIKQGKLNCGCQASWSTKDWMNGSKWYKYAHVTVSNDCDIQRHFDQDYNLFVDLITT